MLWALIFSLSAGHTHNDTGGRPHPIIVQGIYESQEECEDMSRRAKEAFNVDVVDAYCMPTERDRAK